MVSHRLQIHKKERPAASEIDATSRPETFV